MVARNLVVATAVAGTLAACVDLFHGTSFETACDVDAAACEPPDAAVCPATAPGDACSPAQRDAGQD